MNQLGNKMYDWRVGSIHQALTRAGKGEGPLEVPDLVALGHLDQYHYLGVTACDEGIELLDLGDDALVLDVGSGVGGPARYLSYKTGCRVIGIELQQDLNDMAIELTRRSGLADKVSFITGDILAAQLPRDQFDHFVSWLVFLHIADKRALLSVCHDALKPGGSFLIEDMVALNPLSEAELESLSKDVLAANVPDPAAYRGYLEDAGFTNIRFDDMSEQWTAWVNGRYRQHQMDEGALTAQYGKEVYDARSNLYRATADLFNCGNLGGMRISGERAQ